ncbi:protein adenylyltransferase SelO family protein [Asticcacaulis sp.]|uniref:protein adenylyltransferase SelO family protein n=1 Tax=Asticcacaulis sp. TaxID=1872648 RepID=UPI002BAD07A5|nr:YdiU family protein [Asticcacaulis sp.]HTM81857.1 YdiU family protein [Asticcacaulis sp.]
MADYRPAPRLEQSQLALHDAVAAADFPQTLLRYRNQRAAQTVGLEGLTAADWIAHFGRFQPLPDNQPIPLALRYHGHQFRHYNPDLGDGRGFLFAQLLDDRDRLLDLGTKGSGKTPWSRGGDGKLTLKGGVREVLATAMLEALGVPTSKSFSLIETGEQLMRGDEPSPTRSSVLVRLSHSHIRFGTFERLAYHNDAETMRDLVAFILANYYPDCTDATALFDAVVTQAARLAASWMAAGFVHGVLNTDNMNITGESFDYGPYRFLPYYDPAFTAAYFDQTGLYAYGRQPDAVLWNLGQLGRCLTLITEPDPLIASFNAFNDRYERELGLAICQRLNISPKPDNAPLVMALYDFLADLRTDGSFEGLFYDWFGGRISETRALSGPRAVSYSGETFTAFHDILKTYDPAAPEKLDHLRFKQPDPETLLIDEIETIWAQIALEDDWSLFEAKLAAIETYRQAL